MIKNIFIIVIVLASVACGSTNLSKSGLLKVSDLACEYLEKPLGIDVLQPRLSWKLEAGERGQKQTAYHIIVASSSEMLDKNIGDIWDTGKVKSGQSLNVKYGGALLKSRNQYFWKVKVWNKDGDSSTWSKPASWSMGILSQDEWQGQWIQSDLELFDYQKELKKIADHNMETESAMWDRAEKIRKMTANIKEAPAVWMRKEFKSEDNKLLRATVYISGLGLYELYLNGSKINNHLLTVSAHDFGKTVPYHVHDVTDLIEKGGNAIGVILGNGYLNPVIPSALREYAADYINTPRLRFELQLDYEDGSSRRVLSDSSWKITTAGPIRFNSIRSGEIYDARQELGDWSSVGFTDKKWSSAKIAKGPAGRLACRHLPPVRLISKIPAVSVKPYEKGFRFDIGVESTGWARVKLRGKAGQKIVISYPGSNNHTLGSYQTCEYICKGEGDEFYEPRFAFNGYRYVDIYGLDYTPAVTDLIGCQVVSDLQSMGTFSCSDKRLSYLQEVNCRTIRNYIVQVPLDPVREKSGWTQDVQSNFETSAYNFNFHGIYDKWQDDFIDAIFDNGYVPTVIPSCFDGPTINGPWWGGMMVYNPWQLYNFYGDKEILAKSYDSMKQYFFYLESIAENNIIEWGLGDWMDIGSAHGLPHNTTVPYTSTCGYMMHADILRQTASILDRKDDVEYFAKRKEEIKEAVNNKFYDRKNGIYDKGSQTSFILALKLNIIPQKEKAQLIENFRKQIVEDKNHLSTGFIGTPFLLTLLCEEGLADLAWKIATQESYPGWYDMIYNKKNSVFKENWHGGLVQMPSLAGPIGAWFYRSLGGIRSDAPGYKTFYIQPYTETLEWVKCTYESPYGMIRSDWQKKDGVLTMNITVPVNTTATVYIPGKTITESGQSVAKADGVSFLNYENGNSVFKVEAGDYSFESK